jgi:hypothetical protein
MPKNDDLVSIINAGHKKNGTVLRCVGDEQEVRAFSVWAPMAIAAIKALAGTVEHRAVMIEMTRKPPGTKFKRFRADKPPKEFAVLASQAARWTADSRETIATADPAVPEALSNRAADNWLPLFAVADAIGGIWPQKARAAALTIQQGDDDELGVQLLADIKVLFAGEAMHSADLVAALNAREGSPWAEISHGKPLTANRLSAMLRDFQIKSTQIKLEGVNRFGYRRAQFEAAFTAYEAPTPFQNTTATTDLKDKEKLTFQNTTSENAGSVSELEIDQQKQSGSVGSVSKRGVAAYARHAAELPGRIAANGYAIRRNPEDRREPGPPVTCRVQIREIRHPAIKSGPDDDLNDFVAF